MKLLSNWGFSWAGWRQGQHGEYWVVAQIFMILSFVLLPIYQPLGLHLPFQLLYLILPSVILLESIAALFLVKGLVDLGHSLTPLPYPKVDGELVQTGIYGIVRHPLYSGLIFAALSWAILQISGSHLLGAIAFFLFFNAKASREENWLMEKYSDYADYRQRVKKLIPWIY
jgi:protein-S-isoprenylcysteine O-methyltransferase Ste14